MSEQEQKRIFALNLKKLLSERNLSQIDVANAIGVSPQTFNTWIKEVALPRMSKVQALADFFHINKSDLLDYPSSDQTYYTNPTTAKMAQEIFDDPNLRILMDASRDLEPDDLQLVIDMVKRMKKD